jgi:hypothetical protein
VRNATALSDGIDPPDCTHFACGGSPGCRGRRLARDGGGGTWSPVTLDRSKQLSFYYCSAYSFHDRSGELVKDGDIAGVGC